MLTKLTFVAGVLPVLIPVGGVGITQLPQTDASQFVKPLKLKQTLRSTRASATAVNPVIVSPRPAGDHGG